MRNPLRFIADVPRSTSRTHLPDCPAGHVRVAIFTPDGHLSHVKFGELINGRATVVLFQARMHAEPCEPIPESPGARHRVTMPVWTTPD
jgi:hypothetical protein